MAWRRRPPCPTARSSISRTAGWRSAGTRCWRSATASAVSKAWGRWEKSAVIAVADEAYQQARLFETLVVAHRPLKIFRDAEAAYEWLKVEPPASVDLAGTGLFGEAPKIEARRD